MKTYTMSKLEMELLPMRINPTRKYFFESTGQVRHRAWMKRGCRPLPESRLRRSMGRTGRVLYGPWCPDII
jgi:hypothetical protein